MDWVPVAQASVRLVFVTRLHEKQEQPCLITLGTKSNFLFPKQIEHLLLQKFV